MRWSAPGRVRQGGSDARCRAGRGAWHRAATSVPRRGSRRGSSKKNRHGVRSQTVLGLQGGPRQAPRPSGKDCRDAKPSLGERVGPSGGPVRHRAIACLGTCPPPLAVGRRAHIELAWCTTGRGAWAGRGGGGGGGGGEDVEEPGGGSPLHGDPAGAPERPEGRASPGRPRERPRPGRAVLRALCVGLPRPPRRRLPKIRSSPLRAQPLSGVLVLRCTLP
ncbi:unnamed protein product [Prorocentrum cordatum]|uniref:Uncharacterized protein n=1 Tax=Prorocentrum cordatum TaxID=2364126 RepID=A0ABN9PQ47_9DINO|nr:unnamed protein product [Polarella glacialis]